MSDSTFHHITIEPLQDTKNFLVWKIKISNILTNLNYDDHIEDKAAALVDITETAKWKWADKKALATICLQVVDMLLVYIASSTTVLVAWSMLSNMFEAKGPIRIVLAYCKLFGTHFTEESDIENHIHIMWTYQQELATLQKHISKKDFSYALLTSLSESWNNFISTVPEDVIKDPTKLISWMLSELQWLYKQASTSTALAVIDKSTTKYYTCGHIGHFASDHGKQVNREKEEKEKQNNDRKKKKKKEEKGKNRWKKEKGKNSQANLAQNDLDISGDKDFMFLVQDPTLVQSLQPDNWILDSGCSCSIVCNKNNFSLYISTLPHKISGISDTSSSGCGDILLSFALGSSIYAYVLHDVLYCPLVLPDFCLLANKCWVYCNFQRW